MPIPMITENSAILQDNRKKNWFWDHNYIFDLGLSCYAIVVRLYLARCANENRMAFPSISKIAAQCGISRASVKRALAELEEKGLLARQIRRDETGQFITNVYILLDPKVPSQEENDVTGQGGRPPQTPPCHHMTGVGSTGTYYPPGVVGSDRTDLGSDRAIEQDSLKNNINNVVVADNNIPPQETIATLEIHQERQKEEIASTGEGDQGEDKQITQPGESSQRSPCPDSRVALQIQQAFTKVTGRPLDEKALEELVNYPLHYVLAKIAMVELGKDKMNATGWLLEACREDYQHLPVKGKKKKAARKSPLAPRLPDTSQDDKYRDLYRLV